MRVQAIKRNILIQEWAAQIRDRVGSGKSVRKWCLEHGLNEKTYYYHLKRVREELLAEAGCQNERSISEKPVFAAVAASGGRSTAIIVRIGVYSVEIQNGADRKSVEDVLQVLSRI